MKTSPITLFYNWTIAEGEIRINQSFLNMHWVDKMDFLGDCIGELERLLDKTREEDR